MDAGVDAVAIRNVASSPLGACLLDLRSKKQVA